MATFATLFSEDAISSILFISDSDSMLNDRISYLMPIRISS